MQARIRASFDLGVLDLTQDKIDRTTFLTTLVLLRGGNTPVHSTIRATIEDRLLTHYETIQLGRYLSPNDDLEMNVIGLNGINCLIKELTKQKNMHNYKYELTHTILYSVREERNHCAKPSK
jgi:hypothetical protein